MIGKNGVQCIDGSRALGELCNNPLNLMGSTKWLGRLAQPYTNDAGSYIVFDAWDDYPGWVMGFRAAFVDWNTKLKRNPKLTVGALISVWAPASAGNPTAAYIKNVCDFASLTPETQIAELGRAGSIALAAAMCHQEQGRMIYPPADVGRAYDLAHGVSAPTSQPQAATVASAAVAASATVGGAVSQGSPTDVIPAAISAVLPHLQAAGGVSGWIGTAMAVMALGGLAYGLFRLYASRHDGGSI